VLKFSVTSSPNLDIPLKVREQIDVEAIAVSGSYLYALGNSAFYALDTAELAIQNADFPLVHAPSELVVNAQGALAYLLGGEGIEVLNVSAPSAPVALSPAPFVTMGAAADLAPVPFASGSATILYIADHDAGFSIARGLDASPGTLEWVSPSYATTSAPIVRSVGAARGQAYLGSSAQMLWTVGGAPSSLSFLGTGIPMSTTVSSLGEHENQLLAVGGAEGLLRFTMQPNAEPTDADSFVTGGDAAAMALAWPNAVVADGTNGLVIVNIDGPMTLTGSAPAPDANSNFLSVDVQGNYAYVADGNGVFRIYDFSDPSGPVQLGTLAQKGLLDVKVQGRYAYLACGSRGLRIVDIGDPNAPVKVGMDYLELPGVAHSVTTYADSLLVAAGEAGFHMLRIEAGGQLAPVMSFPLGGNTLQLAVSSEGLVYAANEDAGMAIVMLNRYQLYFPILAKQK
jgi:hypothetical protein